MNLEFDILVVVELIFQEITRHDDFDDSCEAWFCVTCTAYLDGSLKDFKVLEVDTYDQNKGRRFGSLLSEQTSNNPEKSPEFHSTTQNSEC